MSAHLVAVVGPSGAGKDTLMVLACAARPDLRAARRSITRPAEAGGELFESVSEAEFERRRTGGDFALSWRAHGLGYGIAASEFQAPGILLVNLSRAVLAEAQTRFPAMGIVLVTAPPAVLAARLAGRGRENGADQAARLARADFALPDGISAREVLNDTTPDAGLERFLAALRPERV